MSSLTQNKTLLILSLLAVGFAAASPVMATPAAFAQNATNPGGNQTYPSGNSTQPTAFEANGNNGMITTVQSNGSQLMVPGQGMMQNQGQMMIKGSIDVKQAIKDFLRDNVNVTLSDAVSAAEAQVNGTAVEGNLNVVQGFLVYTVIVVDINNEIVHFVVVDAGNGDVLASHAIPASELFAGMHGGGMMMGGPGMHGGMYGGGGGPPMMMQPPQGNQTAGIGA